MDLEFKTVGVGVVDTSVQDGPGVVTAIVSVTGIEDNVNDIIEPGAYADSLKSITPKGAWHHDWTVPVSKTIEAKELLPGDGMLPSHLPNGEPWPAEAGALMVKMQFNLDTQRGRDAHSDVLFFGDQQEWSIGYKVADNGATKVPADDGHMVRRIKSLRCYEYSPVLFGAMPAARTASVKDAQLSFKALQAALEAKEADESDEDEDGDDYYGKAVVGGLVHYTRNGKQFTRALPGGGRTGRPVTTQTAKRRSKREGEAHFRAANDEYRAEHATAMGSGDEPRLRSAIHKYREATGNGPTAAGERRMVEDLYRQKRDRKRRVRKGYQKDDEFGLEYSGYEDGIDLDGIGEEEKAALAELGVTTGELRSAINLLTKVHNFLVERKEAAVDLDDMDSAVDAAIVELRALDYDTVRDAMADIVGLDESDLADLVQLADGFDYDAASEDAQEALLDALAEEMDEANEIGDIDLFEDLRVVARVAGDVAELRTGEKSSRMFGVEYKELRDLNGRENRHRAYLTELKSQQPFVLDALVEEFSEGTRLGQLIREVKNSTQPAPGEFGIDMRALAEFKSLAEGGDVTPFEFKGRMIPIPGFLRRGKWVKPHRREINPVTGGSTQSSHMSDEDWDRYQRWLDDDYDAGATIRRGSAADDFDDDVDFVDEEELPSHWNADQIARAREEWGGDPDVVEAPAHWTPEQIAKARRAWGMAHGHNADY